MSEIVHKIYIHYNNIESTLTIKDETKKQKHDSSDNFTIMVVIKLLLRI
jgi:hypothetical protein